MFLLKKVSVLCGICSAVLLLNACANAVFPEIEDEEEITVGEGGRVVRTLPKEGNSLKADEANRAYEGEEESETPANDSVEQIIEKDESVAAVETKPVLSEEKTAPKQESGKTAKAAEASVSDMSILTESSAVLSGESKGAHKIQGIGAGFVPPFYDKSLVNEVVKIGDEKAIEMAKTVAKTEGLPIGVSGGAAIAAAAELAKRDEFVNKRLVVILPDSVERYLSTGYF